MKFGSMILVLMQLIEFPHKTDQQFGSIYYLLHDEKVIY